MMAACLAPGVHYFPVSGAAYLRRGVNFRSRLAEKTTMKYVALVLTLALVLFTPSAALAHDHDKDKGCKSSEGKEKDCDKAKTVPEPGDLVLLSSGLASLGAFSFVRRKSQNK
jgi:hypothetical protein